jgi:hypothetical protein
MVILEVAILFIVRIGVPLICLVVLGHVIDRWQSKQIDKYHH